MQILTVNSRFLNLGPVPGPWYINRVSYNEKNCIILNEIDVGSKKRYFIKIFKNNCAIFKFPSNVPNFLYDI